MCGHEPFFSHFRFPCTDTIIYVTTFEYRSPLNFSKKKTGFISYVPLIFFQRREGTLFLFSISSCSIATFHYLNVQISERQIKWLEFGRKLNGEYNKNIRRFFLRIAGLIVASYKVDVLEAKHMHNIAWQIIITAISRK